MADFSRAEYSKNHKSSFDAALLSTRNYLTELETAYNKYWTELEMLRKERAAIIENAIKVLKNNNIKLQKQLCRCNNEELNAELKRALPSLGFADLEEIQVGIVKINMRYDKIEELSKKLLEIVDELAKFRAPEKDQTEEVVINFQSVKKSKAAQMKEKVTPKEEPQDEMEEVIDKHKASDATVISLNQYLDEHSKKMENEISQADAQVMDSIIEEEDLATVAEQNVPDSDLTATINEEDGLLEENVEEITRILEDSEEELVITEEDAEALSSEKESEEFVEFTIEKSVTLVDIAKSIYGKEEYWERLYEYGTNRGKINRLAAEYDTTVEAICTEPGYLNGIELIFPLELVTYEPLEKDNKKAA